MSNAGPTRDTQDGGTEEVWESDTPWRGQGFSGGSGAADLLQALTKP